MRIQSGCNVSCDYCIVDGVKTGNQMELDDFEEIVDQLTEKEGEVSLTFHGGEPLLAGKDFFREASSIISNKAEKNDSVVSKSVHGSEEIGLTESELETVYHEFYSLWKNDDNFWLSPFTGFVSGFVSSGEDKGRLCSYTTSCLSGDWVGIGPEGDVYPCGRLYDDNFEVGNIEEYSIEEMVDDISSLQDQRMDVLEEECGDCEYVTNCHGGCAADAEYVEGDFRKKDSMCGPRKSLFERIEEDLKA